MEYQSVGISQFLLMGWADLEDNAALGLRRTQRHARDKSACAEAWPTLAEWTARRETRGRGDLSPVENRAEKICRKLIAQHRLQFPSRLLARWSKKSTFIESRDVGVSQFILSGWPKLEEMIRFRRGVLPMIKEKETLAESATLARDAAHK